MRIRNSKRLQERYSWISEGKKKSERRGGQGEQRRNFWKKILSWQDEWKIKLQNERLLKRAAPHLLPTQANLYFWN